ncbi:MAG: hypothetical protein ACRDP5_05915 [Streptosporangiaceae bacterium]
MATVATSAGDISPGTVVFATGVPPVLDGLAPGPPARRVKGHLLVTEPSPVRLAGSLYPVATPLEDGRLLAGGTVDGGDESPGRSAGRDRIHPGRPVPTAAAGGRTGRGVSSGSGGYEVSRIWASP